MRLELFAGFGAEVDEAAVVEARRDPLGRQALLAFDVGGLARDVAGVLHVAHDLIDGGFAGVGELGQPLDELRPRGLGAAKKLGQRHAVAARGVEQFEESRDFSLFGLEALHAFGVREP